MNLLIYIVKENKFVIIIGNKFGGGMWLILFFVIFDGISFKFLFNNVWILWVDKKIEKFEYLFYI